ncbi:uncharacterized protein N7529_000627 [Penicillium soppii]|uniref:uncharacterized protein n=1 Tax=Penicillium soppii TaxID=69789 RepID=UPI002548521B|nr:uncharacterized protein N7529_000627 [Penicillium soppii]KAJ5881955.1 hypothetical protein N7529_000627 [Penicillium soppii]
MASPIMTSHNYYPTSIQLPDYVANESSVLSLILQFGILWAAVVGFSFTLICRMRPSLSLSDRVAFTWMCLSIVSPILLDKDQEITGFIHLFFEAHFVLNHAALSARQGLFDQLWKEYSLSDSRYLTSDAFLVSMEAVTAFCWGPLAFLIAYCIAIEHPVRHALQIIISLGQVYGDVLYYATSLLDISYCRPEGYYFWFYYFFFNFIWMVVGCYYVKQSATEIWKAFEKLQSLSVLQKTK